MPSTNRPSAITRKPGPGATSITPPTARMATPTIVTMIRRRIFAPDRRSMVLIVCPSHLPREEIEVSPRQRRDYGLPMTNNTYRVSEIIGTSPESIDAAVKSGVARAQQTIRNLDWFEVTEIRGHIADGQIAHYQVGMKVGFRLDASE